MVGPLLNIDPDRAFGPAIREYAREVFQETYDVSLLRNKLNALRDAQNKIRDKRSYDQKMLQRLEKMGEYYNKEFKIPDKPKPKRPMKK